MSTTPAPSENRPTDDPVRYAPNGGAGSTVADVLARRDADRAAHGIVRPVRAER